jgi:threonine efflux protein
MTYLPTLLTILGVYWIAVMSPGPNFLLVSQLALSGRRRMGIQAGLGIAAGGTIWAILAMAGVAAILDHVAWLHATIRLAGAVYLLWFGVRLLLGARQAGGEAPRLVSLPTSPWAAFRSGLLTNLTNPKAGAFWTSIFSSIYPPHAPAGLFVATALLVPCISGGWYFAMSLLFASDGVQRRYIRLRRPIDAACGTILVALGLSLAASR